LPGGQHRPVLVHQQRGHLHRGLLSAFPLFVPSLSWQNDAFLV
jgi:hypothetical protein